MMTQKGNPYLRLFSSLSAVRWCVAANYSLHKFSEGKMNDSGTAAVGCAGNSRIKSLWVPTLHMLNVVKIRHMPMSLLKRSLTSYHGRQR